MFLNTIEKTGIVVRHRRRLSKPNVASFSKWSVEICS
jgi:hypothetical protein